VIRAVIEQHGAGPYSAEELATVAGITAGDARRVLEQMVTEGLATRQDR
jgi:DNA-binding IclR family transcriptional regulator